MKRARFVAPGLCLLGCASTVTAGASDAVASGTDSGRDALIMDLAAMPDAAVPDSLDAVARDASGSPDGPVEARVCSPPIDVDGAVRDAGSGDVPYVVELAIGSGAVDCARMSNGTVRCIALSMYGERGDGTIGDHGDVPVEVPGLTDVEQIITSLDCAICTRHRDGTVRCWGSNRYDELGVGHAGDEVCITGPCRTRPIPVPGLSEVVRIAFNPLGGTCAIRADGSVWCWGRNPHLPVSGSTETPSRVTTLADIAAMWPFADGWIVRSRAGEYTVAGVTSQAPDPPGIPREAVIGDNHSGWFDHLCYRLPDSSIRCFGVDHDGVLGDGIRGTVLERTPVDPGLCGVRATHGTFENSCALMLDGTVQCWGMGTDGRLGFPPDEMCADPCATRPGRVVGLDGVESIFGGFGGMCAIRVDHTVWCWGSVGRTRDGALTRLEW